jgi:Cu/Zn superoxide dismutase
VVASFSAVSIRISQNHPHDRDSCFLQNNNDADRELVALPKSRLIATFDTPNLKGRVVVNQGNDKTSAVWRVKIQEIDYAALCPEDDQNEKSLGWHIHERWDFSADSPTSSTTCGADKTGGHYDPGFACGGASQNQCAVGEGCPCEQLGFSKADGDQRTCDLEVDSISCEIGDLSGKLEKIEAGGPSDARYKDAWVNNVENWVAPNMNGSIVFHCGTSGTRVACAQLLPR